MKSKALTGVAALLLAITGVSNPVHASSCGADVVAGAQAVSQQALSKVGETRLRVMLFRIYDAELFTDTGELQSANERLLRLRYQRNFSAERLAEQTREEWQRMGFEQTEESEAWIASLREMWPDVNAGDCIVAHQMGDAGVRFFGNQGELGVVNDARFGEQFLAIWLSEQARFRNSRDELVGVK